MSIYEAYLYLFFDSLIAGLILPIQDVFVFTLAQIFNYDMQKMVLFSGAGYFLSMIINYYFGVLITSVSKNKLVFKMFIAKYSIYLAFLVFIPFLGSIIAVFLGATRVNIKKYSVIVLIVSFLNFYIRGVL